MAIPLQSKRFTDPMTGPRFQKAANNAPTIKKWEPNREAVRIVQQALIELGFPLPKSIQMYGTPDGKFGNETHDAVKAFQAKHVTSEAPDGKVGKNTLSKLDDMLPYKGAPLPPLPAAPSDDLDEQAKQAVLMTLKGSLIGQVNFTYRGQDVNGGWFWMVMQNIEAGHIGVRYDPIVADHGLAVYVPENNAAHAPNHIAMPNANIVTWKQRSVLVHEAVHAAQDLRGVPLMPVISEGTAYIAQNVYHRLATGKRVTDTHPLADAIHACADVLAQRILSVSDPLFPEDAVQALDDAIRAVPIYRTRVEYDGVPGASF